MPAPTGELVCDLSGPSAVLRYAAARELIEIGAPAVEPLVRALGSAVPYARRSAAWALGQIGHRAAVEPLIRVLGDADAGARGEAAEALRALGEERLSGAVQEALRGNPGRLLEMADPRALAPLTRLLSAEEPAARAAAAGTLGRMRDARAIPALLAALEDNQGEVRTAVAAALAAFGAAVVDALIRVMAGSAPRARSSAAQALGILKDQRGVQPLLMALRDRDAEVRRSAEAALEEVGERGICAALLDDLQGRQGALDDLGDARAAQILVRSMDDDREYVRRAAAVALRCLGENAVGPLIRVLVAGRKDTAPAAARILGGLGDARAVSPLMGALVHSRPELRHAAAGALRDLGDPSAVDALLAALGDGDANVRGAAADAATRFGEDTAVSAVQAALQGSPLPLVDLNDPRTVPALLRALSAGPTEMRAAAATALGHLPDPRALDALLPVALSADAGLRAVAVRALGQRGGTRATDAALEALQAAEHTVRAAGADALARIAAPDADSTRSRAGRPKVPQDGSLAAALPPTENAPAMGGRAALTAPGEGPQATGGRAVVLLLAALSDSHEEVRAAAARALGRLAEVTALHPLMALLDDLSASVRLAAAQALGCLGGPEAVAPLIPMLGDVDREVRAGAAAALGYLGEGQLAAAILAALRGDAEAVVALNDARAVAPLINALKDDSWYVRWAAARALGRCGTIAWEAPARIRARLAEEDDRRTRDAYRQAIRQIEDALRDAPAELQSALPAEGRGTELEPTDADGRGTELEAAEGDGHGQVR